jgi:hypothetical protein
MKFSQGKDSGLMLGHQVRKNENYFNYVEKAFSLKSE